jgi:two-component system phosphate regulon response regulator PhoB
MTQEHILIVEDDPDILEIVCFGLRKSGYRVTEAETGESGLAAARSTEPDLVLLDLMLPGMNGLEVCRELKAIPGLSRIPVIFLTARDDERDIVAGLELGADDYVVKPFNSDVLRARIRAVLRRRDVPGVSADASLSLHGVDIHPGWVEVKIDGSRIALTATEFKALHVLARRPGWVFTLQQRVEAIHGDGYVVTDRAVDVMIVGLRRKLGPHGAIVETVRGVGYRMKSSN